MGRESALRVLAHPPPTPDHPTLACTQADAFLEKQEAYAEGYKGVVNSLEFNDENLMRYIWARSLASASGNKELVVALDGKLPL